MACYHWVDSTNHSPPPRDAYQGGNDTDGSPIYVAVAYHEGDELPCKAIPSRRVAYVPYNGEEKTVTNYRVLCTNCPHRLRWVRARDGHVPPGAVPVGRTKQGETLYVGRATHNRGLIVGKVHPSHRCCYIPYGFKEHRYTDYEILVRC